MYKVKRLWILISVLAIATLLIAACSGSSTEPQAADDSAQVVEEADEHMDEDEHMEGEDEHMEGEDEHMEGEDEHMEGEHMHPDVPHEYEGLENPLAGDADALAAGAELFAVNCATCHGETGMGDGPAAAALDPHPAMLADGEMMGELSDAYIFWRITEGGVGEPFNSAMPPWGEVFSETQRWQLVTFIRSLAQ